MKSKLFAAVALTALMATSSMPAVAQSVSPSGGQSDATGAPSTGSGEFTVDNVMPDQPFGDMELDMSAALPGNMSAEQMAELSGRCDVITANKEKYDPRYSTFCESNASSLTKPGSDQGTTPN
jgi:opacity protein-like surface antigen